MKFSASSFSAFTECQNKFNLQYELAVKKAEVSNQAEFDYGKYVHKYAEVFELTGDDNLSKNEAALELTDGIKVSDKFANIEADIACYKKYRSGQTIGLEKMIMYELFEGIDVIGFIDRVSLVDNTVTLIDYKTGKRVDSGIQHSHRLYALWALWRYPFADITLDWQYLSIGKRKKYNVKEEDALSIHRIREYYADILQELDHCRTTGTWKSVSHFEKWRCGYCAVSHACKMQGG